jgi:hypothetical protein
MRLFNLAVSVAACLAFSSVAVAQDGPRPKPAAQPRQPLPVAPKPLKTEEAHPADASLDSAEADKREEKRLDEKLKSICRGC